MWGYQEHYASVIRRLAESTLSEIGAPSEAEVLLVGVRRPGSQAPHPVCLEPENGRWPLSLFDRLESQVLAEIPKHPMSSMVYGDEPSMRDKPEWTRQAVISEQVRTRLAEYDLANDVVSFVITPGIIGEYHVAVVLQVPGATLRAHPELKGRSWDGEEYDMSFIRSCLNEVLKVAKTQLLLPEPGRGIHSDILTASELAQRASVWFLYQVSSLIGNDYICNNLHENLHRISSLRYEGDEGVGRMLVVKDGVRCDFVVRLAEPVQFDSSRWVRKLVQMASMDLPLIASLSHVHGIGRVADSGSAAIVVDFLGHQDWEVQWEGQPLLRTQLGKSRLPQEVVPEGRFRDNVELLFPATDAEDRGRLWDLLRLQVRQPHGSSVIVAADAEREAARLSRQCTRIVPTLVTPELLTRASRIDGGLLIDPTGWCFAIGVILDGETTKECQPSRGARFNSAVRYVYASQVGRMAIVYSDDRTLDIIPLLNPRVSRKKIEDALADLEAATMDTYHRPRHFLDRHRFYLSPEQCADANAAMERIYATPHRVGEIRLTLEPFSPDPAMNSRYLY
jgi:hypothetical protein